MVVYQKARIFDPASPTNGLYVQFNPNTLEYSAGMHGDMYKGADEQPQKSTRGTQQAQGSPIDHEWGSTLSVRLFFHSYISELIYSDVRPNINRIRAFLPKMTPLPDTKADGGQTSQKANSPQITFAWGTMVYTGTLESFHVTYQMFAFDGTPVQAEVSITIRGEDEDVTHEAVNKSLDKTPDMDFSQEGDTLFLSDLSWLFQ